MATPSESNPPSSAASSEGDKRLEHLYDYTKFHIGVYLTIGGAFIGLLAASAKAEDASFLTGLIGSPSSLVFAVVFMVVAGVAGGTVVSAATGVATYDALWKGQHSPLEVKWAFVCLSGREWAKVEHLSFWLSLGFFALSVLWSSALWTWVLGGGAPHQNQLAPAPKVAPICGLCCTSWGAGPLPLTLPSQPVEAGQTHERSASQRSAAPALRRPVSAQRCPSTPATRPPG